MSRRSLFVTLGLIVFLVGGAGLLLYLVVGYEPEVYSQAVVPAGEERSQLSQEFLKEFSTLLSAPEAERDWYVMFRDEQINSYLDEGFINEGLASRVLPEGISHPHVVFGQEKVHLAFRYGVGGWNTVISIDLRVWLAKGEPNAVALELEGFRAGALPISGQWLMEKFVKAGRDKSGMDVTWYRTNGHPVALLRFQADQPHPSMLLQGVQMQQGSLTIRGRSPESVSINTLFQLPGLALKPIEE
ncbi:MAG TPA: hypothetical protein DDY78_03895 [Planctomycetales bacterium]|jgi:hypothetical protein|nr:hypothetical protein [Planctomycetales bacterium]